MWSPGDIAFLPAHSEFRSTPDRPYRENALSLDSELLIARGRAYLETYNIETHFADITCDEITPVARLLHQLVSSNECKAWPLMTDSLVLALTVSIVRKFSPKAEQTRIEMNKSGLNNARTKRVVEFVEANIGNAIRLEDMAAAAALSPYHFTRSFKQAMGMSPTRFVLEQRIRDAQIRLRTTATSLAAIAHDCGFASQSHFTSAFKAAVGITPALFRATVMS